MSGADDLSGLRAHADQTREGLKEVASLVAGYYRALIEAGSPPALALVVVRDWHRATFLTTPPEETDDP